MPNPDWNNLILRWQKIILVNDTVDYYVTVKVIKDMLTHNKQTNEKNRDKKGATDVCTFDWIIQILMLIVTRKIIKQEELFLIKN